MRQFLPETRRALELRKRLVFCCLALFPFPYCNHNHEIIQARDIDLNAIFADCFTASEIDLFSSQLQEYVGDGSLDDGVGNPITGKYFQRPYEQSFHESSERSTNVYPMEILASPGSIPIAAGRTVSGIQQPAHVSHKNNANWKPKLSRSTYYGGLIRSHVHFAFLLSRLAQNNLI